MKPILLVGEAPNTEYVAARKELWLRPDDSGIPHAGNRMRELSGLTHKQYLEVFECENVVHFATDRWGETERNMAKRAAEFILERPQPFRMILLGRKVADAFELRTGHKNHQPAPMPSWWFFIPTMFYGNATPEQRGPLNRFVLDPECLVQQFGGSFVRAWEFATNSQPSHVPVSCALLIPHPSARNHSWSDEAKTEEVRRALREFIAFACAASAPGGS